MINRKEWLSLILKEIKQDGLEDRHHISLCTIFEFSKVMCAFNFIDENNIYKLPEHLPYSYEVRDDKVKLLCSIKRKLYCSCSDFHAQFLRREDISMCVHLLAALLFDALKEVKKDEEENNTITSVKSNYRLTLADCYRIYIAI